jgi:hypothetical protein
MEQGVNMEQLKGTIFYERSDSMAKMAKPFGAMLGEMENVFNSKSGFGYKYAPLNDVLDKARPVLAKHGFGMTQLVYTSGVDKIIVKTILIHESGEYISSEMELPPTDVKGTVQIQKMGASITYARRYQITAMLGMAGEEDTDGVPQGGEGSPKPERQKEPPKPTAKRTPPSPSDAQGDNAPEAPKMKGLPEKLESAVKMINTILNDNQEKIPEDTMAFLDRQYEDIRNMPDTQEKYLQYRDFYAFIQQTMKEVNG